MPDNRERLVELAEGLDTWAAEILANPRKRAAEVQFAYELTKCAASARSHQREANPSSPSSPPR
jgi:hypothetical protein